MEKLINVSVIMGAYNAERTLAKSIESVLHQTYTEFEFIICDDGSADGTAAMLFDFAQKDARIRVIKHEKNEGLAAALNTCLAAAQGEIIVRQDADDISHIERIEKMLQFLDETGADFAGGGVNLFDCGGMWGKRMFPAVVTSRVLGKYNAFMHPTMVFKKSVLEEVKGYRDFFRCEDYDLAVRLFRAGKRGINTTEILLDYFEDRNSYKKHSVKSRLSEFKFRLRLVRMSKLPGYFYFFALKPLILIFVPNFIYKRLHNKKWKN